MSDKFQEKLRYLHDEFDDIHHLRSISPLSPNRGSRSPRRCSRSPRPPKASETPTTSAHDSRPNIAAWPAPPTIREPTKTSSLSERLSPNPPQHSDTSTTSEDTSKLLTMLKMAAATGTGFPRGRESELRRKIQSLEETVADYERQKYNVMGTFTEYRERVAEREKKLEEDYSNKIIMLSEEVLGAKKDFEARMKSFQALQEKFEREKEQALEKLRKEHQKEIQVLEQRFSESQLLNLEQKYIIEIQRLEEERKSLKMEKERLSETFEMKLRRAQSLYETELTAAKMLYTRELEALRDHDAALKEELAARQDEFHDRIQEYQHQAKQSRDDMNSCKNEITMLEKKLQLKEQEVKNISKELASARNATNESIKALNDAKTELDKSRVECRELHEELERKSSFLNAAESKTAKQEATIRELQGEVKTLRNKVDYLEKERENLLSESESQTLLQNSQVQALEAVLESMTKEKETTKEHYEKLLEREREQAEEREYSIKQEFSTKLSELEEQYNSLREQLEQGDLDGVENGKLWDEIECLRSEKSALENEVSSLKSQLSNVKRTDWGEGESAIHDNESQDLSLDYIIELLRAIEVVKKKVARTDEFRFSSSEEEEYDTGRILDTDVQVLKKELKWELIGKGQEHGTELVSLLERIQSVEYGLDDLVAEKNEALAHVHRLEAENVELSRKLESAAANKEKQNTEVDHSVDELQRVVEEQKQKIAELEETVKRKDDVQQTTENGNTEGRSLGDEKAQLREEVERLQNEMEQAEVIREEKEEEIDELNVKVKELHEEVTKLQADLEKKNSELKNLSRKTDEHIRKREEEQELAFEKKIVNLNKEHEKTVEMIRMNEQELKDELHEVKQILAQRQETNDNEVQTEAGNTEENEHLLCTIEELRNELQRIVEEKDDLARKLEEGTMENASKDIPEGRKDRSQSMTTNSEHLAYCQKAANKFHTIMAQMTMTDKKDKKDKPKSDDLKAGCSSSDSRKCKLNKESEKTTTRAKSPSLLTRLRERSPSKSKTVTEENVPTSPTHKYFLCPTDAERQMDEKRRVSPSRFYTKQRKESTSQLTSKPELCVEKSEKRPAWKF